MKEVFLERVLARAEKSGLACQFTLVQEKVLSLRLANSQVIQPAATESFFAHVTLEKEGCAASSHLTGSPDWAVEAAWQKALASLSQGPKLDPLPLAPAVRQIELASAPMPEIGEFTAFAETLASSPGRSGMLQVRERQVAVVNSQGLLRTSRRQLAHFFFSQNGFFELAALFGSCKTCRLWCGLHQTKSRSFPWQLQGSFRPRQLRILWKELPAPASEAENI